MYTRFTLIVCLLFVALQLIATIAKAAEFWQCSRVELTSKGTLRNDGGDKRYIDASGKELTKVDVLRALILSSTKK